MANSSGDALGPLLENLNLVECQDECDKDPRCNNIKVCDKGCTLYDRIITSDSETVKNNINNCYTSFKSCPGGTKSILFLS